MDSTNECIMTSRCLTSRSRQKIALLKVQAIGSIPNLQIPTDWKSGAIKTKSACADSIQACGGRLCLSSGDFNRQVFLQKWDAPQAIGISAMSISSIDKSYVRM